MHGTLLVEVCSMRSANDNRHAHGTNHITRCKGADMVPSPNLEADEVWIPIPHHIKYFHKVRPMHQHYFTVPPHIPRESRKIQDTKRLNAIITSHQKNTSHCGTLPCSKIDYGIKELLHVSLILFHTKSTSASVACLLRKWVMDTRISFCILLMTMPNFHYKHIHSLRHFFNCCSFCLPLCFNRIKNTSIESL